MNSDVKEFETPQALTESKPRHRGDVIVKGTDGERYKTFVCYGCQSCMHFVDEKMDTLEEAYPHFIAPPVKL